MFGSYWEASTSNISLLAGEPWLARSSRNALLSLHSTTSLRSAGTLWARWTFMHTHQNGKIRQTIVESSFSSWWGSDWFTLRNHETAVLVLSEAGSMCANRERPDPNPFFKHYHRLMEQNALHCELNVLWWYLCHFLEHCMIHISHLLSGTLAKEITKKIKKKRNKKSEHIFEISFSNKWQNNTMDICQKKKNTRWKCKPRDSFQLLLWIYQTQRKSHPKI